MLAAGDQLQEIPMNMKKMLWLALSLSVMASAASAAAVPGYGKKPGPKAAPELAGKGAPAALAVIAGGVAIVAARRRRPS